ncbi:hypothetical protein PR202_ga07675 [Eleusine coracana subsp. coracana]|uniref:Uncharacterized protein n=1 Tax=Eleusine coracana subsp. coracana TaxID=191504 RepID=A0AAV5C0I5_ELECO|nr:hypothetical protein PR202_ga07675 [Eleusine coracana subsp. coracana]
MQMGLTTIGGGFILKRVEGYSAKVHSAGTLGFFSGHLHGRALELGVALKERWRAAGEMGFWWRRSSRDRSEAKTRGGADGRRRIWWEGGHGRSS